MQLTGKKAVVLGASAEGGSGWAIAEGLAREGAKVIVAARNMDGLNRLAAKIGGKAIRCDAGSPDDVVDLLKQAEAEFGKIDIAVNSAGLPVIGGITEATQEQVQSALNVNYIGNVFFVKEAAARMNIGGSIILISSYTSVQPSPPHFAYACAKAATDCLVRFAAMEYGHRGIRVNSILPGPIKSAMAKDLYAVPGVEEVFAKEVPLGRIGVPEDYANAVIWLSGPAYVTGLNLPVNGGNQLTRMPRPDELPLGESTIPRDFT